MKRTTADTAIPCAERISLLHLLHNVPLPPSSNALPDRFKTRPGYTLSFEDEKYLTGTIAFLSSVKDDTEHVPAVCVKETAVSKGLTVLIAVNKVTKEDGEQMLQTIKTGFSRVFATLSRLEGDDATDRERRTFLAIVDMCSDRILSRVRLVKNKKDETKQPFAKALGEVVKFVNTQSRQPGKRPDASADSFVTNANGVLKRVDAWAKHQTNARLAELVESLYRLSRVEGLKSILDAVPNTVLDPCSRQSIHNKVLKTARYWESAKFLSRGADRNPLFQNLKVSLIGMPSESFQKIVRPEYAPVLSKTVKQINTGKEIDFDYFCRLLKTTSEIANDQFTTQTKRTLTKGKIHAEVQLLYHCEREGGRLPPRVIASSKDACFLCNALIKLHGKLHIARSHGRLYPTWRLPGASPLVDLGRRFNKFLEQRIRESFKMLLVRQQKTHYVDPPESTLMSLPASIAASYVAVMPEAVTAEKVDETNERTKALTYPSTDSQPAKNSSEPDATQSIPTDVRGEQDLPGPSAGATLSPISSVPSQKQSSLAAGPEHRIENSIHISEVSTGRETTHYRFGALELFIEIDHEDSVQNQNQSPATIAFGVDSVPIKEMRRLRECSSVSVVDVESLEGETVCAVDVSKTLYVEGRGSVARIFFK